MFDFDKNYKIKIKKNASNQAGFVVYGLDPFYIKNKENLPNEFREKKLENINYELLAINCVNHLKRFMPSMPVCVVCFAESFSKILKKTNRQVDWITVLEHFPNSQLRSLSRITFQWLNFPRISADLHSPFQKTLMLDTDYLVFSNKLEKKFKYLKSIKTSFNNKLNGNNLNDWNNLNLGKFNVPLAWATLLFWENSKQSELFWYWVKQAVKNWHLFASEFKLNRELIRFDHAASYAIWQLTENLNLTDYSFDFDVWHFSSPFEIEFYNNNRMILSNKNDKKNFHIIANNDIHFINKKNLVEVLNKNVKN